MSLEKLLDGVQVIAIGCYQWGDSGKGKFSDYFASHWAHVTARGTGGNNAGHTVVVNGKKMIFHLLPAGITKDADGQITILGNGMVIDVAALVHELDELERENMTYNNLRISKDAHVVLPYHVGRGRARNQSQKEGGIGSTGRGIGPAYSDKIARRGIIIEDLLDADRFVRKLRHVALFYPEQAINVDEITDKIKGLIERIRPFVRDTVSDMHRYVREGKHILIEGAQGLLLSIEHGTYPYVTSSDCSFNGAASGVGLSARVIDLPLGIVKFPFMTRVGAGPFPTELGGSQSEQYCGEERHTNLRELQQYNIPHHIEGDRIVYDSGDKRIVDMMNSKDPFIKGIGIRLSAQEYGATTGRPRRTGWVDAVAARYAVGINGPRIILTKPDSLAGIDEFNICYGYSLGPKSTTNFTRDGETLRRAAPQYKTYKGYGDLHSVRDRAYLPASLKQAIRDFEEFTYGNIVAISVGAEREETIIC